MVATAGSEVCGRRGVSTYRQWGFSGQLSQGRGVNSGLESFMTWSAYTLNRKRMAQSQDVGNSKDSVASHSLSTGHDRVPKQGIQF